MMSDGFAYLERDGQRLGWASTVFLGLTIVLCFRSLRWVVIPVAVVQWSLLVTQALLVWLQLPLSMVSSMLTAIVTVIGVATVMHVIVRYREARRRYDSPRATLAWTMSVLAGPVFWACVTDAAGFAALLAAKVGPVQDFGVMMAVGSLVVLAGVFLLLPGLALLGTLDADPHRAWGEAWLDGPLRSPLKWSRRRPKLMAALCVAFFGFTAAGVGFLKVETDFTRNFREDSPIVRSYQVIETRLGGAGVWDILLPAEEKLDWEFLQKAAALQERLRTETAAAFPENPPLNALSLVDAVHASIPNLEEQPAMLRGVLLSGILQAMHAQMPAFTAAMHGEDPQQPGRYYYRVMLRAAERQPTEDKQRLISLVRKIAREEFPQAETTGFFVLLAQLVQSMLRDQWLTFAAAMAGIALVMALAFRSPLYAVLALIPNALPIFTVTGLMGWSGWKINMGAAMIAAVSLGLSVDSSIHYIRFYRLARRRGDSFQAAISKVQATVGRAMVFSTLALIVGFSVLCASEFIPTIYFGAMVSLSMAGGLLGNLVVLPLLLRAGAPKTE